MTAPAVAAGRFGWACLLGLGLGLCYDFLRPLRPRRTLLADSLFLPAALSAVIYFSFQICRGDIRLGAASGMLFGSLGWSWGPGRLLRPVFAGFWKGIAGFFAFLAFPLKKFLKFGKNMFASAKKWVTIRWNNRRHSRRIPGGVTHGREQPFSDSDPPQQSRYQDRGDGGYRVVYHGAGSSALGTE